MIIQKKVKDLIKKIAVQRGMSEEEVTNIVYSYFGLLKQVMKEADKEDTNSFKNVRFMHFGIFAVKQGRLKKLNEKRKRHEDI
tara:strand:+ start:622 stop:870 length:249 start_codon:yes stop_codon:yes gene_type:complete